MTQDAGSERQPRGKRSGKPPLTPAEAENRELADLCRAGKLFAVQEWIAAGKPVNPPPPRRKGTQPQTPLRIAIDLGFHSLVEILLNAGADFEAGKWNGPMDRALRARSLDLVQLLVAHGYDPTRINMRNVFETLDPEIMEYCITIGADAETDDPLASALCGRVRTALSVLKRFQDQDRFRHFRRQAAVALRHHCREGDLKWVSLLLWAGADPYAPGAEHRGDEDDEANDPSALEVAAIWNRFEVFSLKNIPWKVDHPATRAVLTEAAGYDEGLPVAEKLLKMGVSPNEPETGGCPGIQTWLRRLSWSFSLNTSGSVDGQQRNLDSDQARRKLRAIHLLAKAGGRWAPEKSQMTEARRSLLQMIPAYALEFLWIMGHYQGCPKSTIVDLVRTPVMKQHLWQDQKRLGELLSKWDRWDADQDPADAPRS